MCKNSLLSRCPKVSIIVLPSNNYENIDECIYSLLSQTLLEIEVIIICNNYADSEKIDKINFFANLDSRIVIIHQKNMSYGQVLNLAIDRSKGVNLGFIRPNDYVHKDMYLSLVGKLEKYHLDLIRGNFFVFFDKKGERIFEKNILSKNKSLYNRILNSFNDVSIFDVDGFIFSGLYNGKFIRDNGIYFNVKGIAPWSNYGFLFQVQALAERILFDDDFFYMKRIERLDGSSANIRLSLRSLPPPGIFSHRVCEVMSNFLKWIERHVLMNAQHKVNSIYNEEKVWSVVNEYEFIWSFLKSRKELKERLKSVFIKRKVKDYLDNYNHIDSAYKIIFLAYFSCEMKKAKKEGLIEKPYFDDATWCELNDIICNFVEFHERKFKYTGKFSGRYEEAINIDPVYYSQALSQWFYKEMGKTLDLNNPKTYNEKIQWLKIFDSTPLKAILSDKYLVREWVSSKIGSDYIVDLYGVWNSFDEIDFDSLPASFVLKTNHASGTLVIVKDKNKFDKKIAREKFNNWMKKDFSFCNGFELHYSLIERKIIAEEYLENKFGCLNDFKVWCFNGEPRCIQYNSVDEAGGFKVNFFDLNWSELSISKHPRQEMKIPRPIQLEELIYLSRILAKGFSHVRVDFYILNSGAIKFGEMTFTSSSGKRNWISDGVDLDFGNLIDLNILGFDEYKRLERDVIAI